MPAASVAASSRLLASHYMLREPGLFFNRHIEPGLKDSRHEADDTAVGGVGLRRSFAATSSDTVHTASEKPSQALAFIKPAGHN